MHMVQTHASAIFSVLAFILMGFRQFSTAHTNKICMHFRFDILSKAFSNRCLYDENAQRITISLDGGLDASNCTVCVFKRIRISVCELGLNLYKIFFLPAMKNVTKSSNISSIPTPGIFSVIEINKEYD